MSKTIKQYWVLLALLVFPLIGMNAQCLVSASKANFNVDYTQLYLLVDENGVIVDMNSSGSFVTPGSGDYTIHALNFDPADPPVPVPMSGVMATDVGTTSGCFNADFLTDSRLVNCPAGACASSSSVCIGDPVVATSSGATPGYIQLYYLVNAATGLVVASNATGDFTTDVTVGSSYQIHALNYNPTDAPDPLPGVGDDPTTIGGTTAGCFNADFLTDYVCFFIGTCACTPTEVCAGDPVVATSSGGTPGYTQAYYLVDLATGLITATNATGDFTADVVALSNYQIHALNYNPIDPPAPLPGVGDDPAIVGSTTAGCYNDDFLTDYVCFNILDCMVMPCVPTEVCAGDPVIATSNGGTVGYIQQYFLIDLANGLIAATNGTGDFTGDVVALGSYQVHALNYNPTDAPDPIPGVGDDPTIIGSTTAGCFNPDFLTDFVCFNILDCMVMPCVPTDVCAGDPVIATSSGGTVGYTQQYFLIDLANGLIAATNGTGDFTSDVVALGSYQVHALNYNPTDAPDPIPGVGDDPSTIGSTTAGCFNPDFLTDFVCFNILDCTIDCVPTEVCLGAPVIATSSGGTTGYTQAYYLVNVATGLVTATNATGDFTTDVMAGFSYQIHALNYNPIDVPDPLPGVGDDPSTIGSTTAGCFNADFLTDFVCFDILSNPTVTIDPEGPFCTDDAAITFTASPAGGDWTGDSTDGTFDPSVGAGSYTATYTVTVGGCVGFETVTVVVNEAPTASIDPVGPFCDDAAAITLISSPAGGVWSGDVDATGTFDPAVGAGTYTASYTVSANGCTDVASTTIEVQAYPTVTIDPTGPFCTSDGVITLTAGPAGGIWGGDSSDGTFDTATGSGIYMVTYDFSTSAGCSDQAMVTFEVFDVPNAGTDAELLLCETADPVDLGALLGGDAGGVWSEGDGTFDPTVGSGVYTFTYTVSNAICSDEATATVQVTAQPYAGEDAMITLCEDAAAINLTQELSGGPDLGGQWFGPTGSPVSVVFNIGFSPPGDYTYVVDPGAPCVPDEATLTIVIDESASAGADGNLNLCDTDAATYDLFDQLAGTPASGGTWAPTLASGTGVYDPAADAAGVYTYTVPAMGSCGESSASVTVTIFEQLNAGDNAAVSFCGDVTDATDLFAALGGTPSAGGTWTNPAGQADDGVIDSGDAAGLYTYTVASGGPCAVSSAKVEVSIDVQLEAGIDGSLTLCDNDGAVDLFTALGGTPSSGGTWSPALGGGNIFDPAVDAGGTYTYTVGANGSCPSASADVIVTLNTSPAEMSPVPVTACSADGTATLTAPAGYTYIWFDGSTGSSIVVNAGGSYGLQISNGNCTQDLVYDLTIGTQPIEAGADAIVVCADETPVNLLGPAGYNYLWSTGSTNQYEAFDQSGAYTLTISTAEGCSQVLTYDITVLDVPSESANVSQIVCSDDVPVSLNAPDGYSYAWASGSMDQSIDVSATGSYVVTITNAAGCSQDLSYSVLVLPAPEEAAPEAISVCDGPVTLTAPADYDYVWSDGSTASNLVVSVSGSYSVNLSNGGCSQTLNYDVTIEQTPSEEAPTPIASCAEAGPVMLTAPAGYTYSWSDGSSSQSISVTDSGIYDVELGNGTACSQTLSYDVSILDAPGEESMIALSGCSADGAIEVVAPEGYTYSWEDGSSEGSISVDASGTYTVVITNDAGCNLSIAYEVTVNDSPSEQDGGVQSVCTGELPISLDAPAGYSYNWNDGSSAQSLVAGGAGVYSVELTNAAGCTQTLNYLVQVNSVPTESAPDAATACSADGSVVLTGPNGYSYNWSSGSSDQSIEVSASGSYDLTITNSAGCSQTLSYPVTINESPTVALGTIGDFCAGDASVMLTVGSPAGGSYSGPGVTGGMFDPALAGEGAHSITYDYTDANGCSGSASTTVTVNALPVASIDPVGSVCVDGAQIQLTASPAGGSWGGAASAGGIIDPAGLGAGTYDVSYLYTDANGCSSFASSSVTISNLPTVSIDAQGDLCETDGDVLLTASPAGGAWTGADASGLFSPSQGAGSYSVSYDYTDANGCSASASTTITVEASADATIDPVGALCIENGEVLFTAATNGGIWAGNGITVSAAGIFDPAVAGVGTHVITYTIGGTCGGSDSFTVTVEECVVDCSDFTATVETTCADDDLTYVLVVTALGGPGSGGYTVVDNANGTTVNLLAGETNTVLGPFDSGTPISVTVSPTGFAECGLTTEVAQFDCVTTAIELIEFAGRVEVEGNLLYWATASEVENDFFNLMRSTDGNTFEQVAQVDATGNSNITTNYYHLDEDAPRGWAYYQLEIVDVHGNVEETNIVPLFRADEATDFAITPIPTTDFIDLEFIGTEREKIAFEIYDVTGRMIEVIQVETIEGLNQHRVDVNAYAAGSYLVRLNKGESVIVKKFIVE